MRGYVLKEDMFYTKTYHEVRNILHNNMFCYVLVKCNHTFFSEIISIILKIWYPFRSCNRLSCCIFRQLVFFFLQQHFISSETCFSRIYCLKCSSCVCRLLLRSAWLTFFW